MRSTKSYYIPEAHTTSEPTEVQHGRAADVRHIGLLLVDLEIKVDIFVEHIGWDVLDFRISKNSGSDISKKDVSGGH